MIAYLLVALGGALGSVLRHGLTETVTVRLDGPFPWGTFIVNLTGCIAIGFLAVASGPGARLFPSHEARLFLLTGLCGGYTTFSAFSLQTFALLRAGDATRAGAYITGSVVLCVVGTWLGYLLGTTLAGPR